MNTTRRLSLRPLSLMAAACLFAAFVAAAPASAGPVTALSAPADAAAEPAPRTEEDRALLAELAERAKKKALFAARAASALDGSFRFDGRGCPADPAYVITSLWDLRVDPALQERWLARLSDRQASGNQRRDTLYEFNEFVEGTRRLAEILNRAKMENLWVKFSRAFLKPLPPPSYKDPQTNKRLYAETRRRLKDVAAWEASFAEALAMREALHAAKADSSLAERYPFQLRRFVDKPDDLALAVSLAKRDADSVSIRALLDTLATNPEVARKKIADRKKVMELEAGYMYAVTEEGSGDFILLPLESFLPGMNKTMGKRGTVALASRPVAEPEKSLRYTNMEQFAPEDLLPQPARDGSLQAPSFLMPGERLYLVSSQKGAGVPIFAGTPLERFAEVGPRVIPFIPETAPLFSGLLGNDADKRHWRTRYVVAAACGPEELAAHLSSLAVIYAFREKSLYGPYNDFVHVPHNDLRSSPDTFREGAYPRDIPGVSYRLVNVANGSFFLALAAEADKNGLERLMGPIRGVWVRTTGIGEAVPLREMRYTPKSRWVRKHTLGASPILTLEKENLAALVAATEETMVRSLANYYMYETGSGYQLQAENVWPEALEKAKTRCEAVRAKGFVSPVDIVMAAYYLESSSDDPEMREKLRAVLDDQSLSSAKRIKAMKEIRAKGGK